MNRHHPYGGAYDSAPVRRGGSPPGPGPDRTHHRFSDRGGPSRGRGFGRGRGGHHGGFDANMSHTYDQGTPQGDMGAYSNYETAPSQDPYYQNGNYGGVTPAQFGAPTNPDSYGQGYGTYEGALELRLNIVVLRSTGNRKRSFRMQAEARGNR